MKIKSLQQRIEMYKYCWVCKHLNWFVGIKTGFHNIKKGKTNVDTIITIKINYQFIVTIFIYRAERD